MHGTTFDTIIAEAREHLVAAKADGRPAIEPGRWEAIYDRTYNEVLNLSTVQEVLEYAQRKLPFTDRQPSSAELIKLYAQLLFCEFPEYEQQITQFSDDPRCSNLWTVSNGQVVSDIFYWHLRSVIFCMHHVGPRRILDIGGGFGSVARLFLRIENVSRYSIFDLPESLFFAEVCLRSEGHDVSYYDGTTSSTSRVVLVPVHRSYTDQFDLVLNIGSLQEMSQSWVNQYMAMLDGSGLNCFYSLNYGAQPLDFLAETRNWWSCCPGSQWRAQIIAADIPLVKAMSQTRHFAEHLYIRASSTRKASDWRSYRERKMTRQVFLECLDCLRYDSGDFAETAEFVRAVVAAHPEHKKLYKELVVLADRAGLADIAKDLVEHSGGLGA